MQNTIKLKLYSRFLDNFLEYVALFLLMASVTLAMFNVISRAIFDVTYGLTEEICRYTIIYAVFIYVGPIILRNEHLKMDLLQNFLKGRVKHFNNLIISVILFLTFVFLFWTGLQWVLSFMELNLMTGSGKMAMAIPTFSIPLGMFIACIYSFIQIVLDIHNIRNASQKTNEPFESHAIQQTIEE